MLWGTDVTNIMNYFENSVIRHVSAYKKELSARESETRVGDELHIEAGE